MRNLQVSNIELEGSRFNGYDLKTYLRERGIESEYIAWEKKSHDVNTYTIFQEPFRAAEIQHMINGLQEEYSTHAMLYPFSYGMLFNRHFLDADVVHYHLIHNHFFSILHLPVLARLKPSVWTVHDPWAVTGHCIHFLGCEKWKSGCGNCPDLKRELTIREDTTALNWEIKKICYSTLDIDLIVASKWMRDVLDSSPLTAGFRKHVIPFGINLEIFKPIDRIKARRRFGIPLAHKVIAFRASVWKLKGLRYITEALQRLDEKEITLITTNTKGVVEELRARYNLVELGWVDDEETLANFYSAADLFLMPSEAEGFGLSAVEAMACGTPVLGFDGTALPDTLRAPRGGIVVKKGDSEQFFHELTALLHDDKKRAVITQDALDIAGEYYDKDRYVSETIDVYQQAIDRKKADSRAKFIVDQLKSLGLNQAPQDADDKIHTEPIIQCEHFENVPSPGHESLEEVPAKSFEPKVSIIIPVYNGSDYMRDAIDSALAQTYKNTEILVINDGSKDDGATEQIALSYGDRIRYFSKPNGGVASALNYGIEKMTGEYFSWLSHDDMYFETKLEEQLDILRNRTEKDILFYSDYLLVNENVETITEVKFDHEMLEKKPLYGILRGCIHGCSLLIPRHAFEVCGVFNETLRTTQDYDLWFRMMRKFRFRHMPSLLVKSRWHEKQGSKVIPVTVKEADELWTGFIDNLTREEMLQCEKTKYLFLKELASFLSNTPYSGACKYCEERMQEERECASTHLEEAKVSVIIPYHDRIDWVVEAIESVQKQSHKNLEIIAVNNNSTEDISRIKQMSELDKRIVLMDQMIKGPAAARNMGIENATGAYIAFLDSDDLWVEDKVAKQLLYMELNGFKFSHTSYMTFEADGNAQEIDTSSLTGYLFPKILSGCTIATPTVMLSSDIVDKGLLKFREDYLYGEDTCAWIRISQEFEIGGMEEPLSQIRMHGTNAAYDVEKQIIGLTNILKYSIDTLVIANIDKEVPVILRLLMDNFAVLGGVPEKIPAPECQPPPEPEPEPPQPVRFRSKVKALIKATTDLVGITGYLKALKARIVKARTGTQEN